MASKKKLPPGVRERYGRFTYRYSVEVVVGGKRTRKQKETPSFATAKEAYNAGLEIEANRRKGILIDPKNSTLEEWKERWIQEYALEREARPTTVRNRTTAINSLIKYLGAQTRLKDVTSYDYQQYLNKLKLKGRYKGTIQEYHNGAALYFADAVRKEIIATDPTKDAILPAFKKTLKDIESGKTDVPKFLEKKQLKHLLNIIRFRGTTQEYNLFLVLAYTGIRLGELLALKVSDFNEKDRYISVTKTLTVLSGIRSYTLGPPKNDTSIRKVTIGDSVIKAIKSQLAWRQQKIDDELLVHDADFIFWSMDYYGYPASPTWTQERFRYFLTVAELPDGLTPHSLRHTHVSLLAEAGEELAVIQERMGHKNDDITRRVYLHVTEEQKKSVPDRFESVMNS